MCQNVWKWARWSTKVPASNNGSPPPSLATRMFFETEPNYNLFVLKQIIFCFTFSADPNPTFSSLFNLFEGFDAENQFYILDIHQEFEVEDRAVRVRISGLIRAHVPVEDRAVRVRISELPNISQNVNFFGWLRQFGLGVSGQNLSQKVNFYVELPKLITFLIEFDYISELPNSSENISLLIKELELPTVAFPTARKATGGKACHLPAFLPRPNVNFVRMRNTQKLLFLTRCGSLAWMNRPTQRASGRRTLRKDNGR